MTTKVTEADYARLEEQAESSGLNLSEWIRGRLLDTYGEVPSAKTETLLAEVLGMRAILINLLFSIAMGEHMTVEEMQELVERADRDKHGRAVEKLAVGLKLKED